MQEKQRDGIQYEQRKSIGTEKGTADEIVHLEAFVKHLKLNSNTCEIRFRQVRDVYM